MTSVGEVITYSSAIHGLSKSSSWQTAIGLLRQLEFWMKMIGSGGLDGAGMIRFMVGWAFWQIDEDSRLRPIGALDGRM